MDVGYHCIIAVDRCIS